MEPGTRAHDNSGATEDNSDIDQHFMFQNAGQSATFLRNLDWAATPFGPVSDWSTSLCTVVSLCLSSPAPTMILWGPQLVQVYNDAFQPLIGSRHPAALAQPAGGRWSPELENNATLYHDVLQNGNSAVVEQVPFSMRRETGPEERYFKLYYTPIQVRRGQISGIQVTAYDVTEQAVQQQRLELHEERRFLEDLFNAIPVMITMYEKDLEFGWFNREFERVLGWTTADARRTDIDLMEKFYPDPEYRSQVRSYMQSLEPGWRDFRVRAKDGSVVESTWANVPLSGERQVGIGVDIRQRKKAELALRESEERLQAALEAAEVGTWRADLSRDLIQRDARLCRILGLPPRDSTWPINDFLSRLHPDDQERVQQAWKRVQDGESLYDIECRIVHPDGYLCWIRDRGRLIRDSQGRPLYIAGAAHDITEHKEAEEALRESEERFRLAARATKDAVWDWDLQANHVTWSEAIGTVFGHFQAVQGTPGQWWRDHLHPEDRARVLQSIDSLFESGSERWSATYRFRRGDGSYAVVLDRGFVYHDAQGRPVRMIGALQNQTEQKQAEQALVELNETLETRVEARTQQVRQLTAMLTLAEQRERDRIAQILHDDLQQLLYALQLHLKISNAESGAEHVHEAYQLVERAINTTSNLTVDLSPPVLRGEGLDSAITWLATQMKELHGLQVSIVAEGSCPVPQKEMRVLLFQLVRELLFNVVKHADTDQADVSLTKEEDQLLITVTDKGRGFDLESALEDHSISGQYGLFSIQERLSLLGGDLHVQSGPGRGTRVTIIAPRSD